MIKKIKYAVILLITFSTFESIAQDKDLQEWAEKGTVESDDYYVEIPFKYINGYIFIDIIQNGNTFNFMFDTGAEATVVDRSILEQFDYQGFSETSLDGPLVEDQDVQTIIIKDIKLSKITYSEIGAISIDMDFFKEKFCAKVHGIIGNNLMKKSKWQIDYKNEIIRLSNDISKFHLKNPKYVLETKLPSKGFGTETIDITIDGLTIPFDFDTGNGSAKIVAHPGKFKKLIRKSNAVEFGFPKSDKNYYLIPAKLNIGGVEFSNQLLSLENEVGSLNLLGNKFLENFIVTIDWEKHLLYLEPQEEVKQDKLIEYPLTFRANYKTNRIEIATGVRRYLKDNKIKEGSIISKVNEINVLNLSDKDFCEFYNGQWKEIKDENIMKIIILNDGEEKLIVLTKENLLSLS